jgi:hypothetical protein
MKNNIILLTLLIFVFGCSNSDDNNVQVVDSQDFLVPISIKVVYRDGSLINNGDCLSDEDEYAIQIETIDNPSSPAVAVTDGNAPVKQVDYTFNGVIFSMSFTEAGILRTPVNLIDGQNSVQLLETALIDEVRFIIQDDFRQVD